MWIRRKLDPDKLKDLYFTQRLSTIQIAGLFGTSPQTIGRALRDMGMSRRSTREDNLVSWDSRDYTEVSFTRRQETIIVGTLLGDGSLHIQYSSVNPLFSVAHKQMDKEYTEWKYKELESTHLFKNLPYWSIKKLRGKEFSRLQIRSIQHPTLLKYYKILYDGKQKRVTSEVLSYLDPLGLAVYYMDDGGLRNKEIPRLYTYGFLEEDLNLFKSFLEVTLGLRFVMRPVKYGPKRNRGFIMELKLESLPRFRELIVPYILPIQCMSRKIPPSHQSLLVTP